MLTISEPKPEYIEFLSENLREADVDEIISANGESSVWKILTASVQASQECHVALEEGVPVAIFGVAELPDKSAAPWLLGTDRLRKQRKELLTWGRQFVQRWLSEYSTLRNYVDKRNTVAIRWLEYLGFTMGREVLLDDPFNPFYEFEQCVNQ